MSASLIAQNLPSNIIMNITTDLTLNALVGGYLCSSSILRNEPGVVEGGKVEQRPRRNNLPLPQQVRTGRLLHAPVRTCQQAREPNVRSINCNDAGCEAPVTAGPIAKCERKNGWPLLDQS